MGLSSLPAPSDGVLTLLLVNTALSISLLKEILRSVLDVVGLHRAATDSDGDDSDRVSDRGGDSFANLFRSRVKPVRFGTRHGPGGVDPHAADCRVCLTRFEPDSVVNRLPCGHLFHAACLDKWLDYRHATCPLCRTHLLPAGEDSPSWPLL